jgi:uncharacterized protein (DUF2235 family)
MPQRIVMCSDGTGNSFSDQVSNVARVITLIDLSEPARQIAFYDQGIGTNPRHVEAVKDYTDTQPDVRRALTVLDPPYHAWWVPARVAGLAGLTVGYGLRRNVKELYAALARSYEDGASLYLFGFSRGAFTVRVLAGRCFAAAWCVTTRRASTRRSHEPTTSTRRTFLMNGPSSRSSATSMCANRRCTFSVCGTQ